ncbi:RNA polymerase sigma factor [Nonomuraea rubra]|uniref:RNA polymerase sigma factor n=1 Tax=Nonomuraea rubra TaxID=46180 RepID=UPI003606B078
MAAKRCRSASSGPRGQRRRVRGALRAPRRGGARLARQLVRGAEVEDVVAESFTKILDLVGRGGGPDSGFRTYLLTVVRRTVYDRSRVESRQVTTGEIELYDPGVPFVDPALVGLEKSLIARAYLSLPERWRAVLWHTEVERARPADVAPLLGLSANGVAALAYRARKGCGRRTCRCTWARRRSTTAGPCWASWARTCGAGWPGATPRRWTSTSARARSATGCCWS